MNLETAVYPGKTALTIKAARLLVLWDWRIKVRSFESLYRSLQRYPIAMERSPNLDIDAIEDAVQLASIWYWKRILCLQRSCCLFWMLRDAGIPARLQIGAQHWPPRTHAWVNVDGRIVGDMPHKVQLFQLLDTV
jgi:hypothetical protein